MSLYAGIQLPGQPDLENCRKLDLLPLPQINRMMRVGVMIDLDYLAALGSQIALEMADLAREIASYVPRAALDSFVVASAEPEDDEPFNANSAVQIRELLFEMLKVGKGKKLKRTSTGLVSTGKKTLEIVRQDHPVVPKVLAYRERSKLKSAFCDSLPKFARLHTRSVCCPVCELSHGADQWRVHGQIMTTRAETGRLSMKKPNLQQVSVRTELGQKVRAAFLAPPGMRLVSCDLSQIELRDLAHLANETRMIEVYEADGDIHDNTGRKVFGLAPDVKPDKYKHRMASKRTNFSIQNGTSASGLYAQLVMDYGANGLDIPDWLTVDWCQWFIEQWLETYPKAAEYFELQYYRARRYRFVWDCFGRVRRVPEILSCHAYKRSEGERQAQNMPITSASAGQLKLIMAELEDTLERLRPGTHVESLVPIHDQVICEVGEDDAGWVAELMAGVFAGVMNDRETGERRWRVPVKADTEVTERWGVK